MFKGQCFGILEASHFFKLLYSKIRTGHIYKVNNDEPHGPDNQNPNREERENSKKESNNTEQ